MPIRVRLIHESGDALASVTDHDGLISRASANGESALLGYVDPYGDTYFNKLQMPDLLRDWDAARSVATSTKDEECWAGVRSMAEQCAAGTHLYLRFVGD